MISDAVRRFLLEDIGSIERLEVLLLMHQHLETWWEAHALSTALGMPVEAAQAHLERLCARNLLEVRVAGSLIYRYQPGTGWLSQLVEDVSRAHHTDRRGVLALVASPSESVRLFADAFRIRKDKSHG